MSEDSAIQVRGLCKTFRRGLLRKRKKVLQDVSFTVPRGCVYGFLGHNGAGKSTTIKVLLNFIRADAGEMSILGVPPSNPAARRNIGFLPETADYYPFLSPRRLLAIYADILGLDWSVTRRRVEELLEMVGLGREKDEKIGVFSKGMKQRVGIAQALLNEPELLVLDEPASGLDPLGQREIRDLIIDQKRRGRTIFFSSHELSEVEAVCDNAAIIRNGRMVREGTLSQLVPYREDRLVRVRTTDAAALEKLDIVREILPNPTPGEMSFFAKPGLGFGEIAACLSQAGIETLAITNVKDSLEDIFLRLMKEEA